MRILTRKEFQDDMAKAWSEAVESTCRDLIDAAVKAEREACARVAEQVGQDKNQHGIAAAIRARGQA
jgi:hypothetical protein